MFFQIQNVDNMCIQFIYEWTVMIREAGITLGRDGWYSLCSKYFMFRYFNVNHIWIKMSELTR